MALGKVEDEMKVVPGKRELHTLLVPNFDRITLKSLKKSKESDLSL